MTHALPITLLSLMLTGCLPYTRAESELTERFALLHARKLSSFEQRLATERQLGTDDAWTRVGEAWVALSSCEPIASDPWEGLDKVDPSAKLMWATLRLEEHRRHRLLHHKGTGLRRRSISGTMFARLDDPEFFDRTPGSIDPAMLVWPAQEEAWADELPARVTIPLKCKQMYRDIITKARVERDAWRAQRKKYARVRRQNPLDVVVHPPPRTRLHLNITREDAAPKPGTLAWLERREYELGDEVLRLGEALPPQVARMLGVRALLWRTRYHLGFMAGKIAEELRRERRPNHEEAALVAAWAGRARHYHEPLATADISTTTAPAPDAMRAVVLLAHARDLESEGRTSQAIAAMRHAFTLEIPPENKWPARYQLVRLLSSTASWPEVVELADEIPPASSTLYAPYVYRVAYAMRKTGDVDRFIAVTLQAFRDRSYRADPFMRALYIQMMRALHEYPFEARTLELLEDLGPRSLIFERVEAYAKVGLDQGKTENATAAATWLLSKHLNANFHPRYHAILTLAAFLENDPKRFEASLNDVIRRPKAIVEALPKARRATFFARADAELAKIFRQMLPVMAEWGESAKARALRQKWLELVVTRAQKFVRETPESLARPELVELYRIASAMLDEDRARSYPERVGALGPAALVLGTVRVTTRDLDPFEPVLKLRSPGMYSLTLVPRDAVPLSQWTPFWGFDVRGNPPKPRKKGAPS